MSPEREAQIREELAFDGRTGQPVTEADIDESIRRIKEAETADEDA